MTMKRFCVALLLSIGCLCASATEKSAIVVNINGSKYYIHTVQPGETLYGLAKTYAVSEKAIVGSNPSAAQGLQAGASLKIPFVADTSEQLSEKKLRKTFDMHYVAKGETLYGVSRRYAIAIPTIMEDNPSLDPIHLRPGQRILIRKKRIGSENEAGSKAQWEQYRASLNSVAAPGDVYIIVAPGETFYSISRRYEISEAELSQLNDGLQPADLKAGAMLRVPVLSAPPQQPEPTLTPVEEPRIPALDPFADRRIEEIEFRALRRSQTLHIALLLPLTRDDGSVSSNYLEFYQGFLLGLDSVKLRHGRSVDLTLFDTGRDPQKIDEIVATDEFRKSDLVVGPVYEEGIYPVIAFAEQKGIPVVSPLAQIERMNSDVLFQLAPDPSTKYDKVRELLCGDRRVTLIYTSNTDTEYEAEILALLGDKEYRTHKYRYEHPNDIARRDPDAPPSPADLTPLLTGERHLFIVMADNEVDVDRILAALASADTNITARTGTAPDFMVLGNSHWNRYNSIDRTMFFKDRIVFIPTYHAKRDSELVQKFDATYIRAFGALPTLYAYRGYDTAMIFGPAMYNDIEYDMEGRRYTPLQTSYVFSQPEGRHTHVNRNWTRVGYRSDFTISIE